VVLYQPRPANVTLSNANSPSGDRSFPLSSLSRVGGIDIKFASVRVSRFPSQSFPAAANFSLSLSLSFTEIARLKL